MACKQQHVSIHHPAVGKQFCVNCHAYVLCDDNNTCECCNGIITKKRKYKDLNLMFDSMVQTYRDIIDTYMEKPLNAPVLLFVKHKLVTYSVPLSILVLYVDQNQTKHLTPVSYTHLTLPTKRIV